MGTLSFLHLLIFVVLGFPLFLNKNSFSKSGKFTSHIPKGKWGGGQKNGVEAQFQAQLHCLRGGESQAAGPGGGGWGVGKARCCLSKSEQ